MTAIIITLALIFSVVMNVILFNRNKGSKESPNRSVRTTILSGIQNVSELATVRRRFQSIVKFSEGKKIPGLNMNFPGTTRSFMLKYDGTIVCGCDLSKAQVSEPYGGKVRITLPHSEVMDVYADSKSFEVYDQKAGLFTSVKLEDQHREVDADLEKVKVNEVEQGILAHSDENVRKVLTSVVATTGMLADIVFTDTKTALADNSQTLQLEAEISPEQ